MKKYELGQSGNKGGCEGGWEGGMGAGNGFERKKLLGLGQKKLFISLYQVFYFWFKSFFLYQVFSQLYFCIIPYS